MKWYYRLKKLWTRTDYAMIVPEHDRGKQPYAKVDVAVFPCTLNTQRFCYIGGHPVFEKDLYNGRFEPLTY